MKVINVIIGAGLLISVSCSKKKISNGNSVYGLDYYPTKPGKFVVYRVDSVLYTDLPVDTVSYSYQIKEKIADSFTDNLGQPAIRLERYIRKFDPLRPFDSIPWTMKEVWMVNADTKKVQVVEGNVRYTKLEFPILEKNSWNGNANNMLPEWLYTIDYLDKKETINNVSLDKVLLVEQKKFKTLISYQYYTEKYAAGVGLVSREITDIYSNTILPSVPIENRIEKGLIYKQLLLSYGYEE